jgi:diadenosine tetraphosphatase ApaH/serine/threonine PP2A family protein phosphatase
MRIAVVSDIHANLAAFEAVLAHAGMDGRIDAVWSLGDIVGYGPHPNECVAILREHEHRSVAGNHDLAAVGLIGTEDFNEDAAAAALWTAEQLTPQAKEYLTGLPKVLVEGDVTLVHGSLRFPEWEYLLSSEQALVQFELQTTPYSIVGHSHLQFVAAERTEGPDGPPLARSSLSPPVLEPMADGESVELSNVRLILNPGSAGQPRDGDPRVGYALYDTDGRTMTWHRVAYDIAATQQAMEKARLPRWLIERLSYGR